MTKKTLLSIFTAMLVVIILISTSVFTQAATEANGTCGTDVYWTLSDGKLTIIGSGTMSSYAPTRFDPPWAPYIKEITEVSIMGTVTNIGNYAFGGASNLTNVSICDTVTSIGSYAFRNCTSLSEISLPSRTTEIGVRAFTGCSALETIVLPNYVESIGNYAFSGCTKLTSLNLPATVTTIGTLAFEDCSALTRITLSPNNTSFKIENGTLMAYDGTIIYYVFDYTENYYAVPSSVTTIKKGAFPLTPPGLIGIRETVTTIEDDAFLSTHRFLAVTGSAAESYADANSISAILMTGSCGDGVFWVYSNNNLTFFGSGKMDNFLAATRVPWSNYIEDIFTVNINGTLYNIGRNAFRNAVNLTNINLSNDITEIGNYAFQGCESLNTIDLPNSLVTIGSNAFQDCTSLNSIVIPDSVTSLGMSAFLGCTSLEDVVLSKNITVIMGYLFKDCASLCEVEIPPSVTGINAQAFTQSGITELNLSANIQYIDGNAFYDTPVLLAINVDPENEHFSSLDGVLFDKNMTTLIKYPEAKSEEIYSVPGTVTKINSRAFSKEVQLVIMPTVTTIQSNAIIPFDSTTIYGAQESAAATYASENAINFVAIGDSCGTNLCWFYNPSDNSLTITGYGDMDNYLRTVPWNAFMSSIKSIHLPINITHIGMNAFKNANNLTDVYYDGGIDSWADVTIGLGNTSFNSATIHYTEQALLHLTITDSVVTVKTQGFRDEKTIKIAAYSSDNILLGIYNATITDNEGSIHIPDENIFLLKAFVINTETLIPAANTVSVAAN